MLKKGEKSKICALTSWSDDKLFWSARIFVNNINRLGQTGIGFKDHWGWGWSKDETILHPDIVGNYDSFDCLPTLKELKKEREHGYQFYEFAIKYYSRQINK